MKQLGALGLMGVAIGEANGGTGLDYLVSFEDTTSQSSVCSIKLVEG